MTNKNDDNKTLKRGEFWEWVRNHHTHLVNDVTHLVSDVAFIKGVLWVIVPLLLGILTLVALLFLR